MIHTKREHIKMTILKISIQLHVKATTTLYISSLKCIVCAV